MFADKKKAIASLSPLTLAFMGDAVFDLLVREELVSGANRPVKDLHKAASERVCASAQSDAIKKIADSLTQEEADVFRRGRNASPSGHPKNQSVGDYHYATGLECLFGWLYLKGDLQRINELYALISDETEARNKDE